MMRKQEMRMVSQMKPDAPTFSIIDNHEAETRNDTNDEEGKSYASEKKYEGANFLDD